VGILGGLVTPPDSPASTDAAQPNAAIRHNTFTKPYFMDVLTDEDDRIAASQDNAPQKIPTLQLTVKHFSYYPSS